MTSSLGVDLDASRYVLRLADDALILGQRLSEWAVSSPALEEDVALLNIALDLLGQARHLLTHASELEGRGRDEDSLAFLRDEPEFSCALLVQVDNGDFGKTIARQLLVSAFHVHLWRALARSTDEVLAAIAAKAVKESDYHLDHARHWTLRLGDGTNESHARIQSGLDAVWPYVHELFERDDLVERLLERGIAADPEALLPLWRQTVTEVLSEATLDVPDVSWRPTGGRSGQHLTGFGYLLAEMQHLHRSHPGATW